MQTGRKEKKKGILWSNKNNNDGYEDCLSTVTIYMYILLWFTKGIIE